MIYRKNAINPNSEEIAFTLSFSSSDVWRWLSQLFHLLTDGNEQNLPWAMSLTVTKEDLTSWITREILRWVPAKHAEAIASWAVEIAVKRRYLVRTDNGFQLSTLLRKKNGRPKSKT